jgi:hypothetical protein
VRSWIVFIFLTQCLADVVIDNSSTLLLCNFTKCITRIIITVQPDNLGLHVKYLTSIHNNMASIYLQFTCGECFERLL